MSARKKHWMQRDAEARKQTADRRAAVRKGALKSSRVSNIDLAKAWGVSTKTILADRQAMGLTRSVGRMLAGQTPSETAKRAEVAA
jgi:hypothetical protein